MSSVIFLIFYGVLCCIVSNLVLSGTHGILEVFKSPQDSELDCTVGTSSLCSACFNRIRSGTSQGSDSSSGDSPENRVSPIRPHNKPREVNLATPKVKLPPNPNYDPKPHRPRSRNKGRKKRARKKARKPRAHNPNERYPKKEKTKFSSLAKVDKGTQLDKGTQYESPQSHQGTEADKKEFPILNIKKQPILVVPLLILMSWAPWAWFKGWAKKNTYITRNPTPASFSVLSWLSNNSSSIHMKVFLLLSLAMIGYFCLKCWGFFKTNTKSPTPTPFPFSPTPSPPLPPKKKKKKWWKL